MTTGFHEVRFPLRLALGVSGGPVRRTEIVNLSNGRETRNSRWALSRRAYDAGSGLRSVADLYEVLEFFEARQGQLYGFRFRDPLDHASAPPGEAVSPLDQPLGTGDGANAVFQLSKTYGDAAAASVREISRPLAGTVRVAVNGAETAADGFACDPQTGRVTFAAGHVPPAGAAVTAGFEFDVPVRFDIDRIDINISAFRAGRIPTIPLMEILP
ncbi:DUF2460 domain-containing protein [Rhizobiaceae bacterium BDR2-2]|uniref:DUF2460 domain-containing protein n=1 Tax=Ectorhizobium quercum TaxID=2965071 RepID=A0AAE3N0E8_9HYPH|nr:DUF2460 domain-containing protein [Ectorhizobium quercum]MCX8998458.1 DUF2460 domain-containing protein [Ectorhizobium quercum]